LRKDIKTLADFLAEEDLKETLEYLVFKVLKSCGENDCRKGIVDIVVGNEITHSSPEELVEYLKKL
jgi:tartrate dehydratase alpha subunit/fumarate hydratase class I-like protein